MAAIINQGGIAETPEALRAKRDADKRFEESGKKYDDDPSLAGKEQASIRESLGYWEFSVGTNESWGFEAEEEGNPDDILGELDDIELENTHDNTQTEVATEEKAIKEEWEVATSNLEAFREHPATPILERFNKTESQYDLPQITESDCQKILSNIWEESIDLQTLYASCDIDFEDYNAWANLKRYLAEGIKLNPEKTAESSEDWSIKLPEDFTSHELLSDNEDPIVQLLAENYIKLPEWEHAEASFEADMQTCFETTVNKLIDWKQFARNEAFSTAMREIQTGDLETKLKALTYIEWLVHVEQAKWGKKNKEDLKAATKKAAENNNAAEAFRTNQEARAASEAELLANNVALETSVILNQKPEEMGWDIFTAGELDTANASV